MLKHREPDGDTFRVMGRLLAAAAVLGCLAAMLAVAAGPAEASDRFELGIADTAEVLEQPDRAWPLLSQLGPSVIRVTLYWGSVRGVARRRPTDGVDPADPAYDWRLYDRTVLEADKRGIGVVFQIWGTPGWANGGNPPNRAPRNPVHLQAFAYAAAKRYSGSYERSDGRTLPAVRQWIAWNEPNLRLGLVPQWRRVGRKWVPQSAYDYADICTAISNGVHMTLIKSEQVACGATAARGNNNPRAHWQSVAPLGFMQAMRRAGVAHIDAYAHHAYSGGPKEAPWTKPRNPTALTLGNLPTLVKAVTRLWGKKPIWISEYGYETNPPDSTFGVSSNTQARYLTSAVQITRKNPRVDMLMWFLLRDEARFRGWQSGLVSSKNVIKPAYWAFQKQAAAVARANAAAAPDGP
jgi:hypothetical protein